MLIGARVSGRAADAEPNHADVRCRSGFFDLRKDAAERPVLMVVSERFAATLGNRALPTVYGAAVQERVYVAIWIVNDANDAKEVALRAQHVLTHARHQTCREHHAAECEGKAQRPFA